MFNKFFFRLSIHASAAKIQPDKVVRWCQNGLSANLECMSEMRCTLLAENAGRKKNRHFGTIAQLCRAISAELRHISTIGKKIVKQQYLLHMSS